MKQTLFLFLCLLSFTAAQAQTGKAPRYTVTLTLAEGIYCNLPAGTLTVEQDELPDLLFHPEDPALKALDLQLFIDGEDTSFRISADGISGRYALSPVHRNLSMEIRICEKKLPSGSSVR